MNQTHLRAARQAVETDILLGLDAVVLGSRSEENSTRQSDAAVEPTAHELPQEALDRLEEDHAKQCRHCSSASGYTNLVFGEGSATARLMFVGEAPGTMEDQVGRPLVGTAGQKLDEMLTAMGLTRQEVYIANVLKARPPDNRTPLQTEAEACGVWLTRQIEVVQPEVLIALGGSAAKLLLGIEMGANHPRGTWGELKVGELAIAVMPTFHPAYILRQYTPEVRKQAWADLQAVMQRLGLGSG
jgi:uracil-DNA glycosylase family 4